MTEVNTIVVAIRVEIDGPPVWDLIATIRCAVLARTGQGRVRTAQQSGAVEARLGDDAQPWVPVGSGVDISGNIDGDYQGTLVVEHDADGSVGLPAMSTVTVVVIRGSFIAGVSTSMLRVEVEAAMLSGQIPAVISLLLGARDSLGQKLMPAVASF